jgi:two-component system OmpR family response regulator
VVEIIMIEDDEEITLLLTQFLKKYNMNVTSFSIPTAALNSLSIDNYDLMILDLSLPQMDGLEVCKKVRDVSDIPIIISTARGDLGDKVIGLELGADDYIPKPYEPRELVARINTILRRYKKSSIKDNSKEFEIDETKMIIYRDSNPLDLTLAEYEILKIFITKPQSAISREYIANNVDAIKWDSSDRSIDVIISRIRNKLQDDPKNPKYIKSIRGVGYKFIG